MNRKDFIKNGLALGVGLPFFSIFMESCDPNAELFPTFDVKTAII